MPDGVVSIEQPVIVNRIELEEPLAPQAVEFYYSPGPDAIELYSNDYLSITHHPRSIAAQVNALQSRVGSTWMSAVFTEAGSSMRTLEHELAQFMRARSAVICQSGYCANIGLLQCIANERTVAYIDAYAHASLWDGLTLAGAKPILIEHNNLRRLESRIRARGPGIVIVDSIYSQDGSVCPLTEVVDIASRYGCLVVVDESHSLGSHGPEGAGLVVELGLEAQVAFRTVSLAKAFAGRAGLIACATDVGEQIRFAARPSIFSSAVMDHDIAGLAANLQIIREEQWRRDQLKANSAYLREGLIADGFLVDSESHIISLVCGGIDCTIDFNRMLQFDGVFGSGFCAPATALKRSLVRFSVNATLTKTQLDDVIEACTLAVRRVSRPLRCRRGKDAGRGGGGSA